MKDATEQEAEAAIIILKRMIDAAENSNQSGENAVVRAVRAFNNHQALLEITKEVQSALGRLAEQGLDGQAFNALLSKINAAIVNDEKE